MLRRTRRSLALAIAFAMSLVSVSSQAADFSAGGFIDDPDHNEEFELPMGFEVINVRSQSSMHGVAIDGDPDEVVPFIGWEIRLQHSGAADVVDLQLAFVAPTLDGQGHWDYYTSLDQNSNRGVGNYSTRILSEIFQANVSKASYDHTHNWLVKE